MSELTKMVNDILLPLKDDEINYRLIFAKLDNKTLNRSTYQFNSSEPNALCARFFHKDRFLVDQFLEDKKDTIEAYGLNCFFEVKNLKPNSQRVLPSSLKYVVCLIFSYK